MFSPIADRLPDNIYIEITNHCQLRCYMCPSRAMTRKKGIMDINVYKKIINDLTGSLSRAEIGQIRLMLNGQGESMIHPEVFEMIKLAKDLGFQVGLITNGLLLDQKRIDKLIKTQLDSVIFSWYAFDPKTFENVYRRPYYEKFIKNILLFLHVINSTRSNTAVIIAWMESKYNKLDSSYATWFFHKLPVDFVNVSRVRNYRRLYQITNPENDERDLVMEYLDHHKQNNLNDPLVGAECIWRTVYVHWDGLMYPCMCDYNGEYCVGDAKRENILDVWNGERFVTFRSCVLSGDYTAIGNKLYCNDCTAATPKSMLSQFSFDRLEPKSLPYRKEKYSWFQNKFPVGKPELWLDAMAELRSNWQQYQRDRERMVIEDVKEFIKDTSCIAVFGAGEHTADLIEFLQQNLPEALKKIKVLVDSNSKLWGSIVQGYKVISPDQLRSEGIIKVITSSYQYEVEIVEMLKSDFPDIEVLELYKKDRSPLFFAGYEKRNMIKGIDVKLDRAT